MHSRFIGLLVISMLSIGAPAAGRQTERTKTSGPAPRAVVPIADYDFGDIYKGEVISQLFLIRNEGDAELRIESVTAGCGCSVVDSDRVFAPGQEGKAELQVNTVSQSGRISKLATLHTNDPQQPNIVLTVSANVLTSGDGGPVKGVALRSGKHIGPIFLGPDWKAALAVTEGTTGKAEFNVTVERGNLKLLRIEAKRFVSRMEILQEGKTYKVVFELHPGGEPGPYSEQARVVTDSNELPYFFVILNATVAAQQNRQ